MLELFALLSFAVGYLIRLMEMQERSSHFGPFRSYDEQVVRNYFGEEGSLERVYEQPVTLIERIRRYTPFNPYRIDNTNGEWVVDAVEAEVWECPKCLAPWVALVVVIPFMLFMGRWKQIPLMWIAVTGGGYFIYSWTEHFWTYDAEVLPMGTPPSDVGNL